MKKFAVLSALIISLFAWNACSDNNENLSQNEEVKVETFKNSKDLFKFSTIHSQLLREADKKMKSKADFISLSKTSNSVDTLEIVHFYEKEAFNYFSNNPIKFNGETITIDNWVSVDDKVKMNIVRDFDSKDPIYISTDVKNYYNEIKNIIDKSDEPSDVTVALEGMFTKLEREKFSNQDKLAIQLMIGVANDSFEYWYNYAQINPDPKSKSFWTRGNIYADVVAGAQSALWGGAVAGPPGAIMVGISGAFIGSGVKQALSNVLN
ncbi:hypothetical protein [Chryseobacterium polytrichastri]|uniref:Uncharacterized protein n=1 Tax=Chryseobacterium polytrichastri TaxID=1302687 RepID=A0A1M7FBT0_9FLAO|nr:hypothetical protein [Chryseobacterium polytrichastri]SHM01524.1 hypothetical protein SAMN05444267_103137 [Chryseobacterium polytrichastri]